MSEQEKIGRCSVMIAKTMDEYSRLGYDDYPIVGRLLTDAMKMISDHLTEYNQLRFADWLTKQIEKEQAN